MTDLKSAARLRLHGKLSANLARVFANAAALAAVITSETANAASITRRMAARKAGSRSTSTP